MRRVFRMSLGLTAAAITAASIACNLQLAPGEPLGPTDPPPSASGAPTIQASAATPSETGAPRPTETSTATLGPPPLITVSAVGGRLNVRRGPGPEYDFVGALRDGQSSTAIARNSDTTWLLITAPNTSKPLGWVIVTTKYTAVNGPAGDLPTTSVGPAVPAFIRNCTPHEMLVTPNGDLLQDRNSTPENQLQFFPGEYAIFDTTTETEIASVTVIEGRTIDIREDASGTKYSCP